MSGQLLWVESIPTEESEALLTVILPRTPNRSHAANQRRLTAEAPTVRAAMEAMAPATPTEVTLAILRARTPLDRILSVRVRRAGALRTLLAEADGRPVRAPAAPAAVLAHRVQAALAAAHEVGLRGHEQFSWFG